MTLKLNTVQCRHLLYINADFFTRESRKRRRRHGVTTCRVWGYIVAAAIRAAQLGSVAMKKALGERRKHCALVVAKKIRPAADPLPAGQPKFNQLEMVTTFTYRPGLMNISMHAISSYRGNRATNKQTNPQTNTHTQTDRTDYNTLRR